MWGIKTYKEVKELEVKKNVNDDENIENDFGLSICDPIDQKQPLEQVDDLLVNF